MSKPLFGAPPGLDIPADAGPRLILGLDPATSFGFAVLEPDGSRVTSGEWDLSIRKGEGAAMPLIRLRGYLAELLYAYRGRSVMVGYELVERHVRFINGQAQTNTYAAQLYGKLLGVALGYLGTQTEDRYVGVPVGTVKKTATGKGNASKEAMVEAAARRWGGAPGEDEADALWVAEATRLALPPDWRTAESPQSGLSSHRQSHSGVADQ